MKRKRLIADDEYHIASTLSLLLRKEGFNKLGVHSGEAAIEDRRVLSAQFIPFRCRYGRGMKGAEASVNLSTRFPNCQILLLLGDTDTANLLNRIPENGQTFQILAKPLYPKNLIEEVRTHLAAQVEPVVAGPVFALADGIVFTDCAFLLRYCFQVSSSYEGRRL